MGTETSESANDLECRNVTKVFGTMKAVDDVSFEVPKGSFFSILGPSGCGKTTLLRMAAGFQTPTKGDILIKGTSVIGVPPNHRPVNMVFQHLALFPMMNVEQNIAYGLERQGTPRAEIKKIVQSSLESIGLPGSGPKRIDQLSGGQKQRIAIARCLVLNPAVLFLDEPLGALDLKLREHMKIELKKLQDQFGTTFVYITHDQSEALVMSDKVAVMNNGVFEQVGTPQELYYNPNTAFVAGFVGESNRWKGKVSSVSGNEIAVDAESGHRMIAEPISGQHPIIGESVEIFVRPESVVLSTDASIVESLENRMTANVENLLFNGANSSALVRESVSGNEIDVALPQTGEFKDLRKGQEVFIGWRANQINVFATHNSAAKPA